MNRWIAKLTSTLLCLGVFATPNGLSAYYGSCDPCYDSCSTGCGFVVGVDFIYWKPCADDLDFASSRFASISSNSEDGELTTFNFKYKDICPKWEPGVRARIAIRDFVCNLNLIGSYTYLNICDKNRLSAGDSIDEFVNSPLLHPELAMDTHFKDVHGKWDACYHAGDILFAFPICSSPCYNVTPFFGAAGMYFDQNLAVDLSRSIPDGEPDFVESSIRFHGEFWGAGLRIGSDYEYNLACCLKLFGRGSIAILAGEVCSKNTQELFCGEEAYYCPRQTVKLNFCDDNGACHIVPGYHIASGLRYVTCWCCTNIDAHIGYEFIAWHNLPQARRFVGNDFPHDGSTSTAASKRTLAFHGLFVGLNVGF